MRVEEIYVHTLVCCVCVCKRTQYVYAARLYTCMQLYLLPLLDVPQARLVVKRNAYARVLFWEDCAQVLADASLGNLDWQRAPVDGPVAAPRVPLLEERFHHRVCGDIVDSALQQVDYVRGPVAAGRGIDLAKTAASMPRQHLGSLLRHPSPGSLLMSSCLGRKVPKLYPRVDAREACTQVKCALTVSRKFFRRLFSRRGTPGRTRIHILCFVASVASIGREASSRRPLVISCRHSVDPRI